MKRLLVFGSINLDIAIRAARLPAAGETVLGEGCLVSPGGKGANQAHAARRFGMPVAMVGAVGEDAFAQPALAALEQAGVDLLSHLARVQGAPTGCAAIVVDAVGENQIVVAPGANMRLRASQVPDALLAQAAAVLLQMETDAAENFALIARARAAGCLVALNNAPAQALPAQVLQALDLLIVNEGELMRTAAGAGVAAAAPEDALHALATGFALTAVLTRGSEGVLACTPQGESVVLPAMKVQAVDTTGAGDTFSGVLVAALIEGSALRDALALASVAAALACTRHGAQRAQPGREEVQAALPGYLAGIAGTGTGA